MEPTHKKLERIWRDAVHRCDARTLMIEGVRALEAPDSLWVLSLGKTAGALALGALDVWGSRVTRCTVVTGEAEERLPPGAEVHRGEHPIPGPASFAAGNAVASFAQAARAARVPVFVAIGGGASAVCEQPAPGVEVQEVVAAHRALVSSGRSIEEINARRCVLSALKGGRLGRALGDSLWKVAVLVDVPSGDPDVVGSGPCVGTAPLVLATPRTLVDFVGAASGPVTVRPSVVDTPWSELADEVVRRLTAGPGLWVASGEVRVDVPIDAGAGGRARHLALAVLARMQDFSGRWAFLAGASDGHDGSGAAGALVHDSLAVDRVSLARALERCATAKMHDALGTSLPAHAPTTNLTDLYLGFGIE